MRTYEYVIRVMAKRLRGRVAFNGATVFSSWEPRLKAKQLRLNPWCLVGQNQLSVELTAIPEAEMPLKQNEDDVPSFWVHLYRVPDDAEPAALFLMLRYEWSDNEARLSEDTPRTVFEHRFGIDRSYGAWFWLAGEPYAAADREDVLRALATLHETLAQRDADHLYAMLSIRRQEICEALRFDLDEIEREEAAYFEGFFAEEDWGLEPIDLDGLVVIPEAGGRLVRVTRADGAMPFIGTGVRPFVFDVTFGRYDGRWVVAR